MIMNDGEESDQVLMVDGRGSLTTHLLIEKAPYWRASSVVLIKDRFDAAYEAFRDLSEAFTTSKPGSMLGGITSDDALASC